MPYIVEKKVSQFYAYADYRLLPAPHIHTHLELVYLLKGSSMATVDGKEYLLEAGDIFLAFPHQIHSYLDLSTLKI